MTLTPSQFLYLIRLDAYKKKYKKGPSVKENEHMILKAMDDYKRASIHDKMIIDEQFEVFKATNYIEERKRLIKKPKNKRK